MKYWLVKGGESMQLALKVQCCFPWQLAGTLPPLHSSCTCQNPLTTKFAVYWQTTQSDRVLSIYSLTHAAIYTHGSCLCASCTSAVPTLSCYYALSVFTKRNDF